MIPAFITDQLDGGALASLFLMIGWVWTTHIKARANLRLKAMEKDKDD